MFTRYLFLILQHRQSMDGGSTYGHSTSNGGRHSSGGNGGGPHKVQKKVFRGASLVGMHAHVDEAAEAQGVNSTSLHRLEKAFRNVKRSEIIKALKRAGGDVDEAAILLSSYE